MTHEHWTKHLSEAGTIASWGDEQESRQRRAAELRRQAKALDNERAAEEIKILHEARKHWTADEIRKAQLDAETYPTVRDRLEAERAAWYRH